MDAAEAQTDQQKQLTRYAFAGVLAVIAVVYLMRNVDDYQELNTEFRFSELVDLVEPIEETMEAVLLARSGIGIESLASGADGLPDEVLVSEDAHGISIIEGQIIATWMTDESDLAGVTYIRTPKIEDGEVEWVTTGTCGGKKKAC